MDSRLVSQLSAIVGREHVSDAEAERLCAAYDGTGREYPPEAVIWPQTAAETSRILALAHREGVPVVVRGAGSGMTGGALPVKGGLVLATSRMNRILEIDPANQLAVVEPGVVTGVLQAEVGRQGLFYPPDPASLKFCTIGGNVAENAGGPSAVKYGVTRDYVKGLEVALADGRLIHTGARTDKGVVGYDLTRLFVGSEGTLGVITKIILRLLPRPQARRTTLVMLDSLSQAARLVAKALARFTPCALEFMDRTTIGLTAELLPLPLPSGVEAILIVEQDGSPLAVAAEAAELAAFLEAEPGVRLVTQAQGQEETEAIWAARRGVSPAAFKLRPHKISEDVVVPRTRIPDLVALAETLARELDLVIFCFGHAGDGNIHLNIMLDRHDLRQAEAAQTARRRIFAQVIGLGGTLSGEHGVGITKSEAISLEIDPATLAAMRAIKQALDPAGILNPGKIFPQNG
ncbi:MAG: FAD-binding protein [Desulfobacteraceae bacterium]|nr:FAD-binding protein [Desulfobacteraceae bacterium]